MLPNPPTEHTLNVSQKKGMSYKWKTTKTIIWYLCKKAKKKEKKKTEVSRFQTRVLFCSLFPSRYFECFIPCWAIVLKTKPPFERQCTVCHWSQMVSIVTPNEIQFMFICLTNLTNMTAVDPHWGPIVFWFILNTLCNNWSNGGHSRLKKKCCVFCAIFRLYFIFKSRFYAFYLSQWALLKQHKQQQQPQQPRNPYIHPILTTHSSLGTRWSMLL